MGRKRADVCNKQFGQLTVLCVLPLKGKHPKYLCKCSCGKHTESTASQLLRGKRMCWECRNTFISKSNWKGHEEISGEFWDKTIRSAEARGYLFELTIEQGWDLFIKQNRKCALSGVDLIFTRKKADRQKATASLDRIDSSGHYILDNVQWVHKVVNNLKMDLDQAEFIEWCRLITERSEHVVTRVGEEKVNQST